jgi:hypothetical protein
VLFRSDFLFTTGDTVEEKIDFRANMSLVSSDNVDTFDVFINNNYFGSDTQTIQITTNDILKIEVTRIDNNQEALIVFDNKLV